MKFWNWEGSEGGRAGLQNCGKSWFADRTAALDLAEGRGTRGRREVRG